MLDKLLGGEMGNLTNLLTSQLGVSGDQAGGFLSKLFDMFGGMLKGGKLDVGDLISGNLDKIKGGLDMDALGSALGGGADKAEQGLGAVMGPIKDKLGSLDNPVEMISGAFGGLGDLDDKLKDAGGGMIGKIFGG